MHALIAAAVAAFFTAPPPPTKSPTTKSPSKSPAKSPAQDAQIVRTLRTTLAATAPLHAAQGPVWALNVLASAVVLLGPALCTDLHLTRTVSALLALAMRHKKSSVRALGCLVWRCVTWAYFQPPLEGDRDEDEDEASQQEKRKKAASVRETYWKVVKSVVDMGAGVATVAALLGHAAEDTEACEGDLRRAIELVKVMITRGGQTCGDAMEIVKHFVSFDTDSDADSEWRMNKLLPPSLFSASPGLLTVEYKSLVSVVRPIFNQCPQLDDVRTLTREEVAKTWMFEAIVEIWKEGIFCLEIPAESETPVRLTVFFILVSA